MSWYSILVDIIGYMRFSHPARSDLRIHKEYSGRELHREIWSDERMLRRFYCFENLVLPSIRAQEDQDFQICIAASPQMPQDYLDRLLESTRAIDQIDVVIADAPDGGTVHEIFENWYENAHKQKPGTTLHFRIDDDDAFAKSFTRLMRKYARRMIPGEALSFPNGLMAGTYQEEPTLALMHKPFHSIGLGFLKDRFDFRCSPFRGPSHSQTGYKQPAFLVPLSPAWIYVYHSASDTRDFHDQRFKKAFKNPLAKPTKDHIKWQERQIQALYPFMDRARLLEIIENIP